MINDLNINQERPVITKAPPALKAIINLGLGWPIYYITTLTTRGTNIIQIHITEICVKVTHDTTKGQWTVNCFRITRIAHIVITIDTHTF